MKVKETLGEKFHMETPPGTVIWGRERLSGAVRSSYLCSKKEEK